MKRYNQIALFVGCLLAFFCLLGVSALALERRILSVEDGVGEYEHTGGGVIELVQVTTLATNNVSTNGVTSYAVLTAAVEVVSGTYDQVGTLTVAPPTNRTMTFSNTYLFNGQTGRFTTATNVTDHSLHLLFERK